MLRSWLPSRLARFGASQAPNPPIQLAALVALVLLTACLQVGLARLEGGTAAPGTRSLSGDEKRYVEVATAWAAGEPAELDPLWPPGYPAIVALVLRCGGSLSWVMGLQVLALLVAAVALGRIALATGASGEVAAFAAALLVLDPEVGAFARLYRPEALHLALLLVALLLVIRTTAAERQPLKLLVLGTVLGVAVALKSLLLPLVPPLILALMLGREAQATVAAPALAPVPRWRSSLTRGLLVALPFAAVLAPVAVWQHARSGAWTVGGSARFNLWVGLNDRASRSLAEDRTWREYLRYRESGATYAERQAALAKRLRDLVGERGLPALVADQWPRQYFRLFDRESYFTAALPPAGSRYLAGEGYRAAPPWLARLLGGAEIGLYCAILLSAPFGLVRLLRTHRPGAGWVGLLLAYQLALFWFVHVKARYRLTLLPLLMLGTAWTIETWRRRGRAGEARVSFAELALGGAGAALLLCFAFAAP